MPLISAASDKECVEWFAQNKVKIDENCLNECTGWLTDMGTFQCPSQCPALCKTLTSSQEKTESSRPGQVVIYYPGLTPAERDLVDKNPKEALKVFIQKTRAEFSSKRNFPIQDLNDESDAFRHYVWAGLLAKELGATRAKLYLDAHEEDPDQPAPEKEMDNFNNSAGLNAANRLVKASNWNLENLAKEGLRELREKKLKVLKPGLEIPKEPK